MPSGGPLAAVLVGQLVDVYFDHLGWCTGELVAKSRSTTLARVRFRDGCYDVRDVPGDKRLRPSARGSAISTSGLFTAGYSNSSRKFRAKSSVLEPAVPATTTATAATATSSSTVTTTAAAASAGGNSNSRRKFRTNSLEPLMPATTTTVTTTTTTTITIPAVTATTITVTPTPIPTPTLTTHAPTFVSLPPSLNTTTSTTGEGLLPSRQRRVCRPVERFGLKEEGITPASTPTPPPTTTTTTTTTMTRRQKLQPLKRDASIADLYVGAYVDVRFQGSGFGAYCEGQVVRVTPTTATVYYRDGYYDITDANAFHLLRPSKPWEKSSPSSPEAAVVTNTTAVSAITATTTATSSSSQDSISSLYSRAVPRRKAAATTTTCTSTTSTRTTTTTATPGMVMEQTLIPTQCDLSPPLAPTPAPPPPTPSPATITATTASGIVQQKKAPPPSTTTTTPAPHSLKRRHSPSPSDHSSSSSSSSEPERRQTRSMSATFPTPTLPVASPQKKPAARATKKR